MPNYDLGRATGRIVIEYDDQGVGRAREDLAAASEEASSTSESFDKAADGMGIAGLGIAAGFGLAVKAAADFDKVLSEMKAVTGATGEQMDKVREKALQLGADTSFSASQAAEAMSELAKAGVSVDDVLNGAADAAVALAGAGGVELPKAAEIMASAMNTFGLKAAELPKIADMFAGAANASAIGVEEIGEAMSNVGSVAALAGIKIQDVTAAIALMGNQGIKGGEAGTSLATMFSNLNPASKEAADLMKKLGIITKEGKNQFFNAKGEAKSLSDISEILNKTVGKYTKQQKLAMLGTIFGSDAIRSAAILTEQGAKGFDKMSASLTKVKAADVAKERMNNLSGSVEAFRGSLDTTLIKIGSGAQGPLKQLVDALTKAVNWFNNLSDSTRQNIIVVTLVIAGLFLFMAAVVKTVRAVQSFIAVSKDLAKALRLNMVGTAIKKLALFVKQLAIVAARATMTAGRLLLLGLRMAAIGAGRTLVFLAQMARSLLLVSLNAARAGASMVLMAARTIAVRTAIFAIRAATLAWTAAQWLLNSALFANPIGLVILAIIALVALFVILWKNSETFRNIVTGVWNAVWNVIRTVSMAIFNFVKDHWRLIISVVLGPLGIMIALVTKYWRQILGAITTVVKAIFNFLKNNWKTILAVITGPVGIAVLLIAKNWKTIQTIFSNAFAVIRKMITAWVNAVKNNFNNMLSFIRGIPDRIRSIFSNARNWLYNAGRNIIQGLINGALSMLRNLWNIFSSITSRIPKIKGPERVDKKLLSPNGEWVMQSFLDGIKAKIPELESFLSRIGPVNVVGAMGAAAAQTASGAVRAFSPTLTPGSVSQVGTGQLSASDAKLIADALTDAMERRGVGAAIIDGQKLQDQFGQNIGREAALRRRTG